MHYIDLKLVRTQLDLLYFAFCFPWRCRLPSSTRWVPVMLTSGSWKQWSWTAWVRVTLSTRGSLARDVMKDALHPGVTCMLYILLCFIAGLPFHCLWRLHSFGRCWWCEWVYTWRSVNKDDDWKTFCCSLPSRQSNHKSCPQSVIHSISYRFIHTLGTRSRGILYKELVCFLPLTPIPFSWQLSCWEKIHWNWVS